LRIQYVGYVNEETEIEVNKKTSRVNTQFPLDHSTLAEMLRDVTKLSVPWLLGSIKRRAGNGLRSAFRTNGRST